MRQLTVCVCVCLCMCLPVYVPACVCVCANLLITRRAQPRLTALIAFVNFINNGAKQHEQRRLLLSLSHSHILLPLSLSAAPTLSMCMSCCLSASRLCVYLIACLCENRREKLQRQPEGGGVECQARGEWAEERRGKVDEVEI